MIYSSWRQSPYFIDPRFCTAGCNTLEQDLLYLYYISHGKVQRYPGTTILSGVCNTFVAQLFGNIEYFSYLCGVINKHWIMGKTKLVSVRIDEDLLNAIDSLQGGYRYHSRSLYIQAGLKLIIELCKRGDGRKALYFWPEGGDVVDEISFKYHREHK